MTDPRTRARRARPLLPVVLPALLLAVLAAGGWWLAAGRPVAPDELARADAWLRTEALLASPSVAAREDGVALRADLARQLEAFGPAPGDRARTAVRAQRPSPAGSAEAASGGASGTPAAAALVSSATVLAEDALAVRDPALARVLAAAAASRAATAQQQDGAQGPHEPQPCPPASAPAGEHAAGAVLWSALDRAGYALEALSARAELAPAPPAELLERTRQDVGRLLEHPAARDVLAAEPGLRAGAYVLPGDAAERPGRAAETAVTDVQAAAAHAVAHGDGTTACWALSALQRAGAWQSALTGEVDALPGVARDDAR